MANAVQVREARAEDREVLLDLHERLYVGQRDRVVDRSDLPLIDYHDYEQVLADDLAALMADRSAVVLVAESGEGILGYITGRVRVESRRVLPRRGVVEDWYVAEQARGTGIGRALLLELERRLTSRGCDVIESATWAGNDEARKAHDALGFREIRVLYRKRSRAADVD
jgi:ribosomal protein S18 acetylase RimI-like enzyme